MSIFDRPRQTTPDHGDCQRTAKDLRAITVRSFETAQPE
jgi:hypothetical protein